MNLILAADIFGKTRALEEIAARLSSDAIRVTILDPYAGRDLDFVDETQAYDYFQKNVGLQRYKQTILRDIAKAEGDVHLIGFSVGASAIWAVSANIFPGKHIQATCFYGSQIRHYLGVDPKITMELLFPRHEAHFDVPTLISELSSKRCVTCDSVPYRHGFMNRKSKNFNEAGYEHHMNILKNQLGIDTVAGP